MTTSNSTPRLRLTLAWYALVVLLVAVSERPWAQHASGDVALVLGLLLMSGAALGRVWTSLFIAGHKAERLVTTGPYSLCRHPLYALSLLGGLGVGLASRSALILAITMTLQVLLHLRAIQFEEQQLRSRHGDSFRRYCAEVPRLLPQALAGRVPDEITINVPLYWKAFLDAGSFIALYAVILALEVLRTAGRLPTLLVLW
jgi:protein-S-isoprenylcysteine O-methyltransferase Ste14